MFIRQKTISDIIGWYFDDVKQGKKNLYMSALQRAMLVPSGARKKTSVIAMG